MFLRVCVCVKPLVALIWHFVSIHDGAQREHIVEVIMCCCCWPQRERRYGIGTYIIVFAPEIQFECHFVGLGNTTQHGQE